MNKRKDKLILRVDSKQRDLMCAAIMKQHARLTEENDLDSAANSARLHNVFLLAPQTDGMYIVPLYGDVDRNWVANAVYAVYTELPDNDPEKTHHAHAYNQLVEVPTEAVYLKEVRKNAYEQSIMR